jgi:hypothetical protein
MSSLLPELWHMVASQLSIQDATRLRLVNKSLADIAGAYILPEVSFHLHHDDFARLRSIANNRVLAPNVRSLTYFTKEYSSPAVSFEEFRNHHHDVLMRQEALNVAGVRPEVQPADDETLQSEYENYQHMVAVQEQIRDGMADLACLREVLPKFTGLWQVTVSCGHVFYEGWEQEKPSPFNTAFPPPVHMPRSGGVRPLEVLLEALAHVGIKLRSLRAGQLAWGFFQKSPTELERLFRPVRDAEHIDLQLTLDLGETLRDVTGNTERCRELFRQGVVRDLLAPMRRLRILRVGFLCDYAVRNKPARLGDIMGEVHHWPRLTQLELSHVEADRDSLMESLSLHKDTLRFLCLQDFRLRSSTWEELLPELRNKLYLEDACICGNLAGQVLKDTPRDESAEDEWDLSVPGIGENDMRASINCYCQRGGENYPDEIPLTTEVVRRHFERYVRSQVRMSEAEQLEQLDQLNGGNWDWDWDDILVIWTNGM